MIVSNKIKKINLILIATVLVLLNISTYAAEKQKILFIDSYNIDFEWSKNITKAVENSFDKKSYNLKIVHWDSKNNKAEDYIKTKALESKTLIETWQPDVVICADDNASKYLIQPYFKDSKTPFVFCGVNWDATKYGFPYSNVTGMIEVSPVTGLVKYLSKYTQNNNNIGYLALDNNSNKIDGERFKKILKSTIIERYVHNFKEWKEQYQKMQTECDILLIAHNGGITDWDDNQALQFIFQNSKIPSGATIAHMSPFVLINFAKLASEQGDYASNTAKKILAGTKPIDIPVTENKKGIIDLNHSLAKQMKISFKLDDLRLARKFRKK